MQIDREAVARTLLLALVLLAPVALGVLIVHLGIPRSWEAPMYWMMLATVAVLWLCGLVEVRKSGWPDVALVALSMPLFYVAALFTPMRLSEHFSYWSPFVFLPWLFAFLLMSAHLYGRQIYTAMGAYVVMTVFLTVIWYQETVYWILRRYFQWQS